MIEVLAVIAIRKFAATMRIKREIQWMKTYDDKSVFADRLSRIEKWKG